MPEAPPPTPKRKWDWIGLVVRTRTAMQNGSVRIPKGAELIVTYQRGGASLLGKPCDCCGIQAIITKVPLPDLEIVRRAVEAPPYPHGSLYSGDATRAAWPEAS